MSAAPILLSTNLTVLSGNTAIADTGALSTKFRRPFWVEEIRWAVGAIPPPFLLNTRVRTKLSLGRIQISDRFLPFESYCPFLTEKSEIWIDDGGAWSNFRWKLPKPLYIPAGMTLKSEFQRAAGLTPASAQVHVAYAGKYAPENEPLPQEIEVPWVTGFEPATGVTFAQSSERDLFNPFLTPLQVQRLLFYNNSQELPERSIPQLTAVIKDSTGQNVVRDFTRHSSIWDSNRRAWTFNRVLAAKERYNVTLQLAAGGVISDLNGIVVSLVGTRKETLR